MVHRYAFAKFGMFNSADLIMIRLVEIDLGIEYTSRDFFLAGVILKHIKQTSNVIDAWYIVTRLQNSATKGGFKLYCEASV